jgi:hypothetical protein
MVIVEHHRWLERPLRALGQRSRARGVVRGVAALVVVAALAGAVVSELTGSGTPDRHGRPVRAGIVGEPAGYRFPLGCLGAKLSSRSSQRVDEMTNRTGPCWHYGVYVTAVLRRVGGAWRLMLDARSDSCPSVPLPTAIRVLLAACAKDRLRSDRLATARH